jgi:peptide/nickel transport system permease protein
VLKFILHRALTTVPVLFLPSLIVFSLVHLIPGDPVQITLGEEKGSARPGGAATGARARPPEPRAIPALALAPAAGRFGRSLRSHQPVLGAIGERLPVTIELTVLAMFISLSIALPAGVISALRRWGRSSGVRR